VANHIWKPHTTVAAIVETDGKFLLVKERVKGEIVFNQPAGHLNPGETLVEAVIRETLEETQYEFTPTELQGIYCFVQDKNPDSTYIRYLFRGKIGNELGGKLDDGIISVEWMNYDELVSCHQHHRSPVVLQCVEDYLHKRPYSLDLINHSS